ncbi:MAG: single-stranded DNA-binding protein [Candidatus Marinimicrobia bacterium]|nr:single-stranded DNA-binding protein [Candidatus Neomarinimicrobiota bacterium]
MNRNSANRVILVGHIGLDPEIKTLKNDRKVSNFNLASNYGWRDAKGEFQSRTDWHRIVCWGNLAEYSKKLVKGQQVYIEGSLRTREWVDEHEKKHFITEVYADMLTPLGKRKDKEEEGAEAHPEEKTGDEVPF